MRRQLGASNRVNVVARFRWARHDQKPRWFCCGVFDLRCVFCFTAPSPSGLAGGETNKVLAGRGCLIRQSQHVDQDVAIKHAPFAIDLR